MHLIIQLEVKREVTQALKGGEFLPLEPTVHFTPGNYRPSLILGTVSKEFQKAIRGKREKDVTIANGRVTGTGMRKGNRRYVH